MKFTPYINPQEIQKRKNELKRGQTAAFKHALGEAVFYWRKQLAPKHFTDIAHSIYGHPKSGYGHTEARNSKNGITYTSGPFTLNPPYMIKESMQAHTGRTPQTLPMVFSGKTRAGILKGALTVRGSANRVRGSWNDSRINWAALSARGKELGRHLMFTPPSEQKKILSRVDNEYLPRYIGMLDRGQKLPGRLRMTRRGTWTSG